MDYYAEWWEKARNSTGILTKQTYLKQLEQELVYLKANPNYQHLSWEISQWKTKYEKVRKDLKEADELTDKLAEENQEQSEKIKDFQGKILELEKTKQDISDLSTQQIKSLETEKEQIKRSFTNGSAIGNTHWIYWKNENDKIIKANQALQILANHRQEQINSLSEQLQQLETKWTNWTREKKELREEFAILETEITNLNEKLVIVQKERAKQEQELENATGKLQALEKIFKNQITEIIRKNIIFRKSKDLKQALNQIKEIMGWTGLVLPTDTTAGTSSNTPMGEREE